MGEGEAGVWRWLGKAPEGPEWPRFLMGNRLGAWGPLGLEYGKRRGG